MAFPAEIQKELDRVVQALEARNDGKARVCARRAAGAAIRHWNSRQSRFPASAARRVSALTQLLALAADDSFPAHIREAAERLSTTVDHDHRLPFGNGPMDDALIIVRYFAG